MMFALGIHFLNGWMMGKFPASHNEPEWPPHPERVFMALAAAHFETDGDTEEREALEWLEEQGSPIIYTSDCQLREVITTYVPVNDTEIARSKKENPKQFEQKLAKIKKCVTTDELKEAGLNVLPEFRSRQPRTFPVAIPDHPTVYLVWPDVNADENTHKSLTELCRKVTYVGHSASLVQMWVEEYLPQEEKHSIDKMYKWEPQKNQWTRYKIRVTGKGRLKQLESLYNAKEIKTYIELERKIEKSKGKEKKELKKLIKEKFNDTFPPCLRPTSSLWTGYIKIMNGKKVEQFKEPSTCFRSDMLVLRHMGGRMMGLVSTLQLTKALRDTIIQQCPAPIPEWLSGHKEDGTPSEMDHMAIVPLPFVGAEHADGHLLGMGIVIPKKKNDSDRIEEKEINNCFRNFLFKESGYTKSIELKLGRLGIWTLELEERESRLRQLALREENWTAAPPTTASHRWGTVTPVAIDRHAKGKEKWRQVEEIIKDACERIGLPKPTVVIPMPVSVFIGAPHAREFPRITRKNDGGKIFHTHALIEFPEPVRGPVLLGAGRYRGYGFCRSYGEGGESSQ